MTMSTVSVHPGCAVLNLYCLIISMYHPHISAMECTCTSLRTHIPGWIAAKRRGRERERERERDTKREGETKR